jgi:general stress protein CsbA
MIDQIQILTIIGVILLGSTAYLHYTMNKLQEEVKAVWLQIAIVAAATAKEFKKIEKEKEDDK